MRMMLDWIFCCCLRLRTSHEYRRERHVVQHSGKRFKVVWCRQQHMLSFSALSTLSIVLDGILCFIAFFIASMSYRLHRLFRKPRYRQFSLGFFLIGVGYLCATVVNILVSGGVASTLHTTVTLLRSCWSVAALAGLLVLTYLYYDVADRRLRFLLASLLVAAFLLGGASAFAFFVLSGLLFLFISMKLYPRYRAKPERSRLFLLLGFAMLFIAKLFSGALFLHGGLYIGYYVFKLAGAILIAWSMWVISR